MEPVEMSMTMKIDNALGKYFDEGSGKFAEWFVIALHITRNISNF